MQFDREVGYSDFRAVLITIHESCHDSKGILENKFLKVCKMWIINLIPAWDHDNFVLRIWNPHERCSSIEKLALSTLERS